MSVNRNIFYTFLTQLPTLLLGVAAGVFITRILGAGGRGIYTIFYNDIQFLCLFFSFGLNTGLIYFISNKKIELSKLAGISILLIVTSTVLLGLLLIGINAIPGNNFIFPEGHRSTFFVAYLLGSFALSILHAFISAMFQGKSDFKTINFVSVLNSIVNFLLFLGLYLYYRQSPAEVSIKTVFMVSALGLIFNSIAWMIFYFKLIKVWPSFKFSLSREIVMLFSFVALIHLSNLINFFNYRLDLWIVEHYRKSEQLGIYSLSANIAQMFWMISTPIASVLLPHLSSGKQEEQIKTYAFYSRLNFSLVLTLSCIAFFCAGLIPLVYGNDFIGSILPFQLLMVGILFSCVTKLMAAYVISRNRNWYTVIASTAGFAITLTLDLLLIPKYGIVGASIATIVSYLVIFISYFYFTYGRLKLPFENHFILTKADVAYLKGMIIKRDGTL